MGFGTPYDPNNPNNNTFDLLTGKEVPFTYDTYTPTNSAAQSANVQLGPASQGRGMVQTANGSQLNTGQSDQARGYQNALLQQLQAQANGTAPSLAQMQLRQATDQNLRNQMGLMSSQRGNPMAGYQAAQQFGQAGSQLAQQSAQARLAEQLQAQGLMGQVSGQMRGQDTDIAGQNAQLAQQLGMFNSGQYNTQLGADMNARNQFGLQQGQMNLQNNQYNAGQQNNAQDLYNQLMAHQAEQNNEIQGGFAGNYQKNNMDEWKAFVGGAFNAAAGGIGNAAHLIP